MLALLIVLLLSERPNYFAPIPPRPNLEQQERDAKLANAERLILAGATVAEIERQANEIEQFYEEMRR